MQVNESYIDGTPVNISGRVPKGHIVVNNKWRNSNIISSLHGLYLMTKLGVNEGDNIGQHVSYGGMVLFVESLIPYVTHLGLNSVG